jgi:hypothetical protein
MSQKERAVVAELRGTLAAHDAAAIALMRNAERHLRRARAIEAELSRLQRPRKADSRLAFA